MNRSPDGVPVSLETNPPYKFELCLYRDQKAYRCRSSTPYTWSISQRFPWGTWSNGFTKSKSTEQMWTSWANSHAHSWILMRVTLSNTVLILVFHSQIQTHIVSTKSDIWLLTRLPCPAPYTLQRVRNVIPLHLKRGTSTPSYIVFFFLYSTVFNTVFYNTLNWWIEVKVTTWIVYPI